MNIWMITIWLYEYMNNDNITIWIMNIWMMNIWIMNIWIMNNEYMYNENMIIWIYESMNTYV